MSYSLEQKFEIWNDHTGERIDVGPDRDGLDMIEIRSVTKEGEVERSIVLEPEQAVLVGEALCRLLRKEPTNGQA